MLEAVNSVIQSAPVVRANAEQISTSDSFAANPQRIQKAPQAPFVSPYISVDSINNAVVLQIRDGDTGDVKESFPSKTSLQAREQENRRVSNETTRSPFAEVRTRQQSSPAPTQKQLAAFSSAASSGQEQASNSVSVLA
jgi:hypothetical protein